MAFAESLANTYGAFSQIREDYAARARRKALEDALATGDINAVAAVDPNTAAQLARVQSFQQEQTQGQDDARRGAQLRGLQLLKAGVPLEQVNALGGGSLFNEQEAALLGSPDSIAAYESYLTGPQAAPRQTQPVRPFSIMQDGKAMLATYGPDGELRILGEAPASAASGMSPLQEENVRSQIEAREAQAADRRQRTETERQKQEAQLKAKADFAASSNANALRAVDKALAFFGEDANGDGEISPDERYRNVLNASQEQGVGRIVGAVRRRGESVLPGTAIARLKQQIAPLKGIVGLDRLVELKSSGATLGQVSNFELQTLQSTLGNLEQVDDPEQLFRDLSFIKQTLQKINASLAADGYSSAEEGATREGAQTQPSGGRRLRFNLQTGQLE